MERNTRLTVKHGNTLIGGRHGISDFNRDRIRYFYCNYLYKKITLEQRHFKLVVSKQSLLYQI